jgi:hypothetical protein
MTPSTHTISRRSLQAAIVLLFTAALSLMANAQGTGDRPFISEIVAVGNDSFQDEDGDSPDWIEIYNPSDGVLNLAGYHLTDDSINPTKWTFPDHQIPAGSHLIVFASDKDRATAGSEFHSNFKLSGGGEYLALIEPNGTTITSEFTPTFPAQASGFSYGIEGLAPDGTRGYFDPPSPDEENGTLLSAPLVAPIITPACATFTSQVEVTIAPAFAGGQVRYTTNGSEPISSSPLYSGPLNLTGTTQLRARVFDSGAGGGGAVAAGTFQKLATSSNLGGINPPGTFTSDLPIMIVENFGNGSIPGPGSTLQTARVSVFDVDPLSGRSSLANGPDSCFRIGIRRRGQSSSGFSKPQYRVELRDENDDDLDYPLLGLPSESDWVFNGPWTDKSLVRNSFSFELGRTLGNEAPGTKHFEMFLSTNGGDLVSNEYVGVYVLFEKIKQGKNRTDIAELSPSDNSEPDITGGYMMRFEPPGIANDGPRASGWSSVEIIEPSTPTTQQRNYLGNYLDDFVATLGWSRGSGANNSGIINPDPLTGYPAFIDVDSFVNHFIISELGRDQDAYVRSDYMFKDRGGKLHKGPIWDHNLIMGTGCCFDNRNPLGWQYLDSYNRGGRDHAYEPDWFVPLMRDPDFSQRFIDRWTALRQGGPFDLPNLFDRLNAQADPLAEAAIRNFTRWNTLSQDRVGFPTPATQTWEQQIDFMKDWLTTRTAWIDGQFLTSPKLSPSGGVAFPGNGTTTVQSSEAVYYTTDGSDPRLPGGGINPSAQMLPPSLGVVPVTFFDRENVWAYLDDGSDQGASNLVVGNPSYNDANWKSPKYDDRLWPTGNGIFGFGGLGNPRAIIATPMARGPASGPHRTYYFRKTFQIESAASILSLQAHLLRDDGAIIYLNGNEVGRSNVTAGRILGFEDITLNSARDEKEYFDITLNPSFLVDGENVISVEIHQDSHGSSDLGFDLELTGTVPPGDAPTISLAETTQIRARARSALAEWSGLNESLFVVGIPASRENLVISEINYHPTSPTAAELANDPTLNDDDFEWIEIRNIADTPIDISGVAFVDGIEFKIPAGTLLQPGGYALFVENESAFELRHGTDLPVIGTYSNKLNNDGESIRLIDLAGSTISEFVFNDTWYQETDGNGATLGLRDESLVPSDYNDPLNWQAGSQDGGSPGKPDLVPGGAFEEWQTANFTPAELTDPLISGPLADADLDSLSNFLEYGMGLDPKLQNFDSLPTLTFVTIADESFLALEFQRRKNLIDGNFSVEVSADLVNWSESSLLFGEPSDNLDGTETITLRHNLSTSPDEPRQMIRLRFSQR